MKKNKNYVTNNINLYKIRINMLCSNSPHSKQTIQLETAAPGNPTAVNRVHLFVINLITLYYCLPYEDCTTAIEYIYEYNYAGTRTRNSGANTLK